MIEIESEINNLILTYEDLKVRGIWDKYFLLRSKLYKANKRNDCIIVQGSAFVIYRKAFLLIGVGGIDFLDSLGNMKGVNGIIGNGNSIFISKDFKYIYSSNTTDELKRCYEFEEMSSNINFIESAELAPLIILIRSFRTDEEYDALYQSKYKDVLFQTENAFAVNLLNFAGSYKARLRNKFIATSTVVHCARRPTLLDKECLFDSREEIKNAINQYNGNFLLVYTKWSQELCDAIGMNNTRKLSNSYNPTDPITKHLFKIANESI